MTLQGVRYVAAVYGLVFAVLLVWVAMVTAKVRRIAARLDDGDPSRDRGAA